VGGLALSHAFTWFSWYYGPIYPFYALLTAIGASQVWRCLSAPPRFARVSLAAIVTALLLGQMLAVILVKLPHDRSYWVKGYLQAADVVPRDPNVRVAAFEIGAVGWRIWPAQVLDVTGLVTPGAVGVRSDIFIRAARPDYIVLKNDTAADFLAHVQSQPWFLQQYELIYTGHDPYGGRDYCTYRLMQREKGPEISPGAGLASKP
ncbi:MAG: hypothetical protein M3Y13_04805, partial [Armatimonadota bacterium]|nr:hypothetical protein [Armatimonadota bacterium]